MPRSKIRRIPWVIRSEAHYGQVFTADDVEPIVARTGIALADGADGATLIADLSRVADFFVLQAQETTPPGECADWLHVGAGALIVLSDLFENGEADALFRAAAFMRAKPTILLDAGFGLVDQASLRLWFESNKAMLHQMILLHRVYTANKNTRRMPDHDALELVTGLAQVYQNSFGRKIGYSTSLRHNARGGPAIRFVQIVTALLLERRGDHGPGSEILLDLQNANIVQKRLQRVKGRLSREK